MADENNGNLPEMSPEEKKLHDMLQRELIHYSMTFKDSIDAMAVRQREETQKLIEQNLTGVVDAILAKNEQNAQLVVDKTIAALRAESEKQQQAAPRPQPGTTTTVTDPNNPTSTALAAPAGPAKPLDFFLMSIGQFLQNTTPKDIIDLVKTLKGGPAVNTMAADQMIQAFRISKLFTNIKVAETDIGAFEKMAHEALDTRTAAASGV
jgi:hypothetical protein